MNPLPVIHRTRLRYGRAGRRKLMRALRRWERRPIGQRKRHVLLGLMALMLLGGWSIRSTLSSPSQLLRVPFARRQAAPAPRQPQSPISSKTHEPNPATPSRQRR